MYALTAVLDTKFIRNTNAVAKDLFNTLLADIVIEFFKSEFLKEAYSS